MKSKGEKLNNVHTIRNTIINESFQNITMFLLVMMDVTLSVNVDMRNVITKEKKGFLIFNDERTSEQHKIQSIT